ncbi:MAG: Rieske (2Fe-2S) protein [Janthinobacterium lividum]
MPNEVFARHQEYAIGPVDQIPFGEGREFQVMGLRVAVFRTRADAVYATQAACPHKEGPLADGMLGGSTIMCPLHDRSYDLVSGTELGGTCSLTIYLIRRDPDGTLLLTLPAPYTPAVG